MGSARTFTLGGGVGTFDVTGGGILALSGQIAGTGILGKGRRRDARPLRCEQLHRRDAGAGRHAGGRRSQRLRNGPPGRRSRGDARGLVNPNYTSLGGAIDRLKGDLSGDRGFVLREIYALPDDQLDDAMRMIAGEVHASNRHIEIRSSEAFTDLVRNQITERDHESEDGQAGGAGRRCAGSASSRAST